MNEDPMEKKDAFPASPSFREEKQRDEMMIDIVHEAKEPHACSREEAFLQEVEAIQKNLCLVLEMRELSLISDGREKLIQTNAVPRLVEYIRAVELSQECSSHFSETELSTVRNLFSQLKLNALRALFNLSVVDSITRRQIVNAGAIPLLLKAATLDRSECQPAAVGTLANLATESDIKFIIVKRGLNELLRLLRSEDIAVKAHACRALFAIAANDDNKLAISEAGGLSLLLECMMVGNVQVQVNAAGALANLAIHPVNKPKLVESGALHILQQLAYSDYAKVQRQVARCLFALAAHTENRVQLWKSRCLTGLVYMLSTDNEEVQRNAAGAIGNIAMSDELKLTVVEAGALQPLIVLSQSPSELVQRQAARAIFTLSAKEEVKHLIVKGNGIEPLVALTRSAHKDIQRDSAGALANMAIGPGNKNLVIQYGALRPLMKLLHSNHQMVQRQAARAMFALAGSTENQSMIIEEGGLIPLIQLLDSGTEVQKHAAGAIANLANNYTAEIVQCEGDAVLKVLSILMTNANPEVRRQANRALLTLLPPSCQIPAFKSRYVGVAGERQRLRHDMRNLLESTKDSAVEETVCGPLFFDGVLVIDDFANTMNNKIPFHTNIVFGRCPRFHSLASFSLGKDKNQVVCFTAKKQFSRLVWEALLEYIYTDSIRCQTALLVENSVDLKELARLAEELGLARLVCLCHEIMAKDPSLAILIPLLEKEKMKTLRASSWVKDMEYITKSGLGFSNNKTVLFQLHDPQRSKPQRAVKVTRQRRAQRISFEHSSPRHFELGADEKANLSLGIPVHKEVLVARCPYFRAQYSSSLWSDSGSSSVNFAGSKACLMILMRYLYCGLDKLLVDRIQSRPSVALEVLVYANLYNLEGLFPFCETCLSAKVSSRNAIIVLSQIECVHAPLLRTHCIYVILKCKIPRNEWVCLSDELVKEIEACRAFWKLPQLAN